MANEILAAVIQTVGTITAAAGAGVGIFYQIGKQGELSRKAIIEGESRKLKAQMYEESMASSRAVMDAAIELNTKLAMTQLFLRSEIQAASDGKSTSARPTPFQELLDLDAALSEACLRFVYLLENRRIIDPRLIVFRDVLNCSLHDQRECVSKAWMPVIMRALPHTLPDGQVAREPFSQALAERSIAAADNSVETLNRIIAVMEDFSVDIQNLLLGDVFETKVAHRVLADPAAWVATIERQEEARTRIAATPWGRKVAELEAEAAVRFAAAGPRSVTP